MATLPAPVVGKALEWLAKAAAAAAAAVGANEAIKDKPATKTREADCSQTSDDGKCGKCLLINGRLGQPPTPRYIVKSNRINYDYQLQIANMYAGPERFGYVRVGDGSNTIINIHLSVLKDFFGTGGQYITLEWIYGGVAFDGFWRELCTVVETKANYGNFLDEFGDPKKAFMHKEFKSWPVNFMLQMKVVETAAPTGSLEWHFMDPKVMATAISFGMPPEFLRYTPYAYGVGL